VPLELPFGQGFFHIILTIPLLEFVMSASIANAVQSVVGSSPVVGVEMLHGRPVAEINETIVQIGFDTIKAYDAAATAERSIAQCQTALFDWVKGLNYVEFQHVRSQFIIGGVDAGKTSGACEQIWDKQINQICKAFEFTRPKSEAKDAVRKAEQKAKREAELAKFDDKTLHGKVVALTEVGTPAALREAANLAKEMERRNKPVLDAEEAARKATVDKINARVKELAKAKTKDADDLLVRVLMLIG
jgi:hypothetical protein